MSSFHIGDRPTFKATFKRGVVATDPTAITFEIRAPSGVKVTYEYPGGITKIATGVFQVEHTITAYGRWYYRWSATGDVATSSGDRFIDVESSVFD